MQTMSGSSVDGPGARQESDGELDNLYGCFVSYPRSVI